MAPTSLSLHLVPGLLPHPAELPALALLCLAGALASAINAIAGGGSLVSFPALVALGVPALSANATNSAALTLGNFAGALGFLTQLGPSRRALLTLFLPTVLGAAAGAWLLTHTSETVFRWAVPGLLCLATTLLAFQPRIRGYAAGRTRRVPVWAGALVQFAVSIYGGYFGAGMGILMIASLGLFLPGTLHELNAIKNWLSLAINVVAAALLVAKGLVWLWPAVALGLGSILGGYVAARGSQRVPAQRLRRGIVVLGAVLTAWFTWHALGHR
ncbi:MAG TPA: sulfite exporter TauE/SafE family protein [Polyangia bacterium]|jgi:hypothetical protein|nr:sulfite exporter TauE/SafE family protein [Polyangia bacterium]